MADRRQRAERRRVRTWDGRVRYVQDLADSPGFRRLRTKILAAASLECTDRVLDIGAGTGLLALAAAPRVAHVIALDSSPAMCRYLHRESTQRAITNLDVMAGSATNLPFADASFDVVLSNYCFHHLKDPDKHRAVGEAERVLRPNGRLVIGDVMFRIGFRHARDRAVIAHFVAGMARRGPAGMTRLAKHAVRFVTGRGEHPSGIEWWRQTLDQAGFSQIVVVALQHEGGIATARRPQTSNTPIHETGASDTRPIDTSAVSLRLMAG
jgi:ubiquinone/menaquinone biosynthesis C-methylase UbiE